MFPLTSRKLIRGAKAHVSAGLGVAADYEANYIPLCAPFAGTIETYSGPQGGNWTRLIRDNGDRLEFAHLSKYKQTAGRVSAGEQIAVTGNTGTITTGPHLHIQILRNGKRLDPEKYEWETLKTTFMKITVVANRNKWTTLPQQISQLNDYFKLHSGGRLEIVGDIKKTEFSPIPLVPFNGSKCVDPSWYRLNVTPLTTGQISVFVMNPEDYPNDQAWGWMTYGDPNRPVRVEISPKENILSPEGTPIFVVQAFHEICHALFFLTGQPDKVHELIYPSPGNPKAILDLIDYPKLQEALIKINPNNMAQIKSQAKGSSRRIVLEASDLNEWAVLCKVYGKDKDHPEETVS